MNTLMDTCYECKDTFDEGFLMKCELCEEFVCRGCIQWCNEGMDAGLDNGGWDDDICGDEGEILHAGCSCDILEVCDSDMGIWGGKRCEQTWCWNHHEVNGGDSCSDCDSSRCGSCSSSCESCYCGSCISSDCGGICDSCEVTLCEDHIRKCRFSNCSRQFCFYEVRVDFPFLHRLWRRIIRGKTIAWRWKDAGCSVKNNMQYCETDDGYFCIDHVEHQCSVK
jgi:hypothetical protein